MPRLIDDGEVENVRVVVRVRPLSAREAHVGFRRITSVDSVNNSVSVEKPQAADGEPPKSFAFDAVFDTDSTQLDVYNETARPIVDKVLQGYNGTIFAYGQTGTGKTFTMEGNCAAPELKGIIPNSFAHIFGHIAKAEEQKKFLVRVAYIEIYNEEIRDLLFKDQTARLEVKESTDIGVYIRDLSAYVVNNADDMDKLMTMGKKNRVTGSTAMNSQSSRSHAIFTITIENGNIGPDGKQHIKMGKLHLVDLAGSERQSKTGATGQRFRESTKINLSLSVLGNVISALVDGKSTHIPYRNSKLTRLLQDSLGGNSKTVMIANIGPADYNYDETISTLRYASRAKKIKNRARINEDPKDALLRQFQLEIEDLRRQLEEGTGTKSTLGDGSNLDAFRSSDDEGKGDVKSRQKARRARQMLPAEEIEDGEMMGKEKDKKDPEEVLKPVSEKTEQTEDEEDKQESELQKTQKEHDMLRDKLQNLEKKILVGGENLLEKAELQEQLLEASARELEQRKRKEELLRQQLQQKEAELIDIEERYSTLQEEAVGKTKKLKKVYGLLLSAKGELADLQHEQQREMEGLLDSVRSLTRELKLQEAVIDAFIPREYQEMLEQYIHWNEDVGEWQLKCVAYTGNNMRKQISLQSAAEELEYQPPDLSHVYLSYSNDRVVSAVRSFRPPSALRGKSAHSHVSVARPASRRPRTNAT